MSAVSNRFTPASIQISIWRRASSVCTLPMAANRPSPPSVIVPKLSTETSRPLAPNNLYSMPSPQTSIPEVSTGDPPLDMFNRSAHKFRVSFPAGWLRNPADEAMLRRAIDADKPAHTSYDLRLVEARFRVGDQSTIGVDTIVGGVPVMRLGSASCQDLPPSLQPVGRLGYDTILSGAGGSEMRLAPGVSLGGVSALA